MPAHRNFKQLIARLIKHLHSSAIPKEIHCALVRVDRDQVGRTRLYLCHGIRKAIDNAELIAKRVRHVDLSAAGAGRDGERVTAY